MSRCLSSQREGTYLNGYNFFNGLARDRMPARPVFATWSLLRRLGVKTMRGLQYIHVYDLFTAIFTYHFVIQVRNLRRNQARPCPNSMELLRKAWFPRFVKLIQEVRYFEAARFRSLLIMFLVVLVQRLARDTCRLIRLFQAYLQFVNSLRFGSALDNFAFKFSFRGKVISLQCNPKMGLYPTALLGVAR